MQIRNLGELSAVNTLNKSVASRNISLQKLSSGLKINRAKDNPAGLVISEQLRSQLFGINQAMRNSQEAMNTLSVAEGGMVEMSGMLADAKQLAVHALNSGVTSGAQVTADQSQLNSILDTFSRITNTTSYANKPLLNGAQSINFRASDPQNMLDLTQTRIDVVADEPGSITASFAGGASAQAEKAHVESAAGATLATAQEFSVSGSATEATFSFAAGTALSDVATAINEQSEATGVVAHVIDGGTRIRLVSDEYGADAAVRVSQSEGALFAAAGSTVEDAGQNATLTVKGMAVSSSDGATVEVANASFRGTLAFNEGAIAQTGYDQDTLTDAAAASAQMGDIRGGMQLQLAETSGAVSRERFGIRDMQLSNIGRVTVDGENYSLADLYSGGKASLANNPEVAAKVLDQAVTDVASARGSIGAYQSNTLQRNINGLSVAYENTTATESNIRDTDFAEEATAFMRAKILSDVGITNIQSANVNAANVLRLLGGV